MRSSTARLRKLNLSNNSSVIIANDSDLQKVWTNWLTKLQEFIQYAVSLHGSLMEWNKHASQVTSDSSSYTASLAELEDLIATGQSKTYRIPIIGVTQITCYESLLL